jgi:hypothetical protein
MPTAGNDKGARHITGLAENFGLLGCHRSGVEVAIRHRQFGRNLAQRFVDGYFAHTA